MLRPFLFLGLRRMCLKGILLLHRRDSNVRK